MQEYPWANEFPKGMISGALKAVKRSELYKGADKFFMFNCNLCMSYYGPVS